MGILLAVVHSLPAMVWFTLLIFGSATPRAGSKGGRGIRIIDSITGTVLLGFGLKVALEPAQ